jgi:hypothetical protein
MRGKQRVRALKNSVLRKIFRLKWEEVITGHWEKTG